MKHLLILLLLAALVLPGCKGDTANVEEDRDPRGEPEDRVMTASQLMGQVRPKISQAAQYTQAPLPVPPVAKAEILRQLQQDKSRLATEENGPEASRMVVKELFGLLPPAEENKSWEGILLICDCVDVFDPGNSRLKRYRDKANLYMSLPRAEFQGVLSRDGEVVARIRVYLPTAPEGSKDQTWYAHEGEEEHGVRVEEIYQDRSGVKLRILETNDVIELKRNRSGLGNDSSIR